MTTTNGDQPATQADLATWGGRFQEQLDGLNARIKSVDVRIERVETRIERVEMRIERVEMRIEELDSRIGRIEESIHQIERTQAAMLEMLDGINKNFQAWSDLPAKVERIHNKVFPR